MGIKRTFNRTFNRIINRIMGMFNRTFNSEIFKFVSEGEEREMSRGEEEGVKGEDDKNDESRSN